jgi:hypothetical protein
MRIGYHFTGVKSCRHTQKFSRMTIRECSFSSNKEPQSGYETESATDVHSRAETYRASQEYHEYFPPMPDEGRNEANASGSREIAGSSKNFGYHLLPGYNCCH